MSKKKHRYNQYAEMLDEFRCWAGESKMPRKLHHGVIAGICEYCVGDVKHPATEIPSMFALWTGISVVSSILGRSTYLDRGHYGLFPNLYIVLVAGSAKCRKSTAIEVGRSFLKAVEPPVRTLSQKMTPEALISALSGIKPDESGGQVTIVNNAVGSIIVDELSTFIDKRSFDSGLIALLTKLYDCGDFDYETISRKREAVANPCLVILGGSTLQWIREAVPITSVGGGFTGRVIFVHQSNIETLVAWPEMSKERKELRNIIISDLNEIAKMRGPFGITADAKDFLGSEYVNFFKNHPFWQNMGLCGYAGRRQDTLLKVCMVMSAAFSDSRLITIQDAYMALESMKRVELTMPRVLASICAESHASIQEEIIDMFQRKPQLLRSFVLRKFSHRLTSQMLDVIIDSLAVMRLITQSVVDGDVMYSYTGAKKDE